MAGAGAIVCALLSWGIRFIDVFTIAYMIGVYVVAFIVFHGDSGELSRHMSFVNMLYRITPAVALACIWERVGALAQRGWVFRRRRAQP